jgi:uncharacterized protein
MVLIKHKLKAKGMTCNSCEKIIAKQVLKLPGVNSVDVDYSTENVEITYDNEKTNLKDIKNVIEEKGYICKSFDENKIKNKTNWLAWTFAGIGFVLIMYFAWTIYGSVQLPQISQNMGYGLLFIVGLLTGFHCVGMCGGFVVSYTAKGAKEGKKPAKLHLSYAIGKTLSYTVIGAIFGLLGSIIAFTPAMRGWAGILAGLFLVLFGLKMLNIFPVLRKFKLTMPQFLNKFLRKENKEHSNNPLIIGLLNGLMIACGPLQAIYVMAAGTGSMIEGAKLLFIFALGTLPVMLGFGYLTSIISKKATHKILKASGVIVIILGLVMVNRGLALTGTGYDLNSLTTGFAPFANANSNTIENTDGIPILKDGYQEIRMEVNRYGWSPDKFILQKGLPVKWIIDAKELNGCNNAIQVPKYGLEFDIKQGEQIIEFTPTESGTVSWSCWMGMIPGVFIVQDEVNVNNVESDLGAVVVPSGGSCGAGGGGCGCGG